MKIYRATCWDKNRGQMVSWHGTRLSAEKWIKIFRPENGEEQGPTDWDLIDVPTDKAGLIRWLNINMNTDNG